MMHCCHIAPLVAKETTRFASEICEIKCCPITFQVIYLLFLTRTSERIAIIT